MSLDGGVSVQMASAPRRGILRSRATLPPHPYLCQKCDVVPPSAKRWVECAFSQRIGLNARRVGAKGVSLRNTLSNTSRQPLAQGLPITSITISTRPARDEQPPLQKGLWPRVLSTSGSWDGVHSRAARGRRRLGVGVMLREVRGGH